MTYSKDNRNKVLLFRVSIPLSIKMMKKIPLSDTCLLKDVIMRERESDVMSGSWSVPSMSLVLPFVG